MKTKDIISSFFNFQHKQLTHTFPDFLKRKFYIKSILFNLHHTRNQEKIVKFLDINVYIYIYIYVYTHTHI